MEVRKLSEFIVQLYPGYIGWACPGCMEAHFINVRNPFLNPQIMKIMAGPVWSWDENAENPTFNPSVLVTGIQTTRDGWKWAGDWVTGEDGKLAEQRCHCFIRNGYIEYLGDCTHSLAGQRIKMVPWPEDCD
jgi:hypothetical protein